MSEMKPQEIAEELENIERSCTLREPLSAYGFKALCYAKALIYQISHGALVPLVHAQWGKKYDDGSQNYNSDENWYYVCSKCGGWDKTPQKYCHCCGALMDGQKDVPHD